MATIMEGALWTLTEAAAERMVENGLIIMCDEKQHPHTLEADKPIYHVSEDAPGWFGFATMDQAIRAAEAHVTYPELKDIKFLGLTFDPTANPEPGGPGSFTVVKETPDAPES